jgi:nitrate reductase (cytochrome), electron transfer subunit
MHETVPPPGPQDSAKAVSPARPGRFVPLLAVIGISIATVGFLTGIREPRTAKRAPAPEVPAAGDQPAAVTYAELPTAKLGLKANRQQTLAQLQYDRPGVFDPVMRTEEMKREALADRARNRAYDGAPPTIPHPVESQSASSCLACHGQGLKVGERFASKMSHAHLTSCTQCHAEQAPTGFHLRAEASANTFVGVYRAGPGERASPGAPPSIPHHTWMREDCASCHGLVTRPGTRTTHPWLTNCAQCHAPSAHLDQVHFPGGRR